MKFKIGDRIYLKDNPQVRGKVCHLNDDDMIGADLGHHNGAHDCEGHCSNHNGFYFNAREIELIIRKKLKPEDLIL